MHSALLWASCNNDTATEGLLALVRSGLRSPQELPEFFWGHLERDIQLLARALGKNLEEAAIVIHLVLKNVLLINPSGCRYSVYSDIILYIFMYRWCANTDTWNKGHTK